jgi:hypothetical protein
MGPACGFGERAGQIEALMPAIRRDATRKIRPNWEHFRREAVHRMVLSGLAICRPYKQLGFFNRHCAELTQVAENEDASFEGHGRV